MTEPVLSVLVVVHNEEAQLADCLEALDFADELVVVLDKCTDGSKAVAERFNATLVEGAWEIEGHRRNEGLDACHGAWILEVDADERANPELGVEIRAAIDGLSDGYFLLPFDNYIGARLVRHGWGGSWGVSAAPRLSARGAKRWGEQRIHPSLRLTGPRRWLTTPIRHNVDKDISDMLRRLDRYSSARAADLRAAGDIGNLASNIRRMFSRFAKCYLSRKGYREGAYGFLIALMAGLYPILSHLKARLERDLEKE
ncbi:MAG: glycosyltransferase family 2 protein [Rhodospirillaceae bacterium]|jgi:glycosyltransferase involved in cell wall biosynthesis|nr:glycosyltransferase family 2 protein [Rhodospirillaceae bacterium]MBT3491102.1 glycosyltransferase family 2 protein [Rhodospirillaceae bacterium]MBT3781840.1 glycosyltransferase family 2 protein [Rhodospirillaceae bacterium]MBT3975333.1 glycosyltransferase family 2 protein [Rhodospirillaceae bacterium]MBT4171016.1 glycosyltransferase family 2 protein [Rhodospirillaceae bacterium]